MKPGAFAIAALAALGLAACVTNRMPTPDQGAQVFADHCAACHGYTGQGDDLVGGQAAPDLTQIAAVHGGSFPRAQILSVIDGYGQGQHPGQVMPEFGAILQGDTVPVDIDGTLTPTPRPLAALLLYLESIQIP